MQLEFQERVQERSKFHPRAGAVPASSPYSPQSDISTVPILIVEIWLLRTQVKRRQYAFKKEHLHTINSGDQGLDK